MAVLATWTAQSSDTLDYNIDYTEWIEDDDAPASAEAAALLEGVETANITVENVEVLGKVVRVWLSGGVSGETYTIEVTTTTQFGRIKQDEFRIKMRDV